jgi:uncharacterized protein YjdB
MKQKLFFLALTLLFLSVTSMNAQVQIGGTAGPNASAILDLNPDEGDATLGLKLPVIELGDVSVFQLSGTPTNADGIMVYNSSDATTGGSGKGIYVWEGKWIFAGKSAPVEVPVTKITITSDGYAKEVTAGVPLQLTATVEPANASNKTVRWTQVYNPSVTAGQVTIDDNGEITGVKAGSVTVRATAIDGFGAYRDIVIVIKPNSLVSSITIDAVNNDASAAEAGSSLQLEATVEPETAYPGVTWTVDNSDIAVVNTSGLVSLKATGTVTITARAQDGSNVTQDYPIVVTPSLPLSTVGFTISDVEYQTYMYLGKIWTVENMRHGTPLYTNFPGFPEQISYYYSYDEANNLCTDGFRLPTAEDLGELMGVLASGMLSTNEAAPWVNAAVFQGYTNNGGGVNWGGIGCWWGYSPHGSCLNIYLDGRRTLTNYVTDESRNMYGINVRCVK